MSFLGSQEEGFKRELKILDSLVNSNAPQQQVNGKKFECLSCLAHILPRLSEQQIRVHQQELECLLLQCVKQSTTPLIRQLLASVFSALYTYGGSFSLNSTVSEILAFAVSQPPSSSTSLPFQLHSAANSDSQYASTQVGATVVVAHLFSVFPEVLGRYLSDVIVAVSKHERSSSSLVRESALQSLSTCCRAAGVCGTGLAEEIWKIIYKVLQHDKENAVKLQALNCLSVLSWSCPWSVSIHFDSMIGACLKMAAEKELAVRGPLVEALSSTIAAAVSLSSSTVSPHLKPAAASKGKTVSASLSPSLTESHGKASIFFPPLSGRGSGMWFMRNVSPEAKKGTSLSIYDLPSALQWLHENWVKHGTASYGSCQISDNQAGISRSSQRMAPVPSYYPSSVFASAVFSSSSVNTIGGKAANASAVRETLSNVYIGICMILGVNDAGRLGLALSSLLSLLSEVAEASGQNPSKAQNKAFSSFKFSGLSASQRASASGTPSVGGGTATGSALIVPPPFLSVDAWHTKVCVTYVGRRLLHLVACPDDDIACLIQYSLLPLLTQKAYPSSKDVGTTAESKNAAASQPFEGSFSSSDSKSLHPLCRLAVLEILKEACSLLVDRRGVFSCAAQLVQPLTELLSSGPTDPLWVAIQQEAALCLQTIAAANSTLLFEGFSVLLNLTTITNAELMAVCGNTVSHGDEVFVEQCMSRIWGTCLGLASCISVLPESRLGVPHDVVSAIFGAARALCSAAFCHPSTVVSATRRMSAFVLLDSLVYLECQWLQFSLKNSECVTQRESTGSHEARMLLGHGEVSAEQSNDGHDEKVGTALTQEPFHKLSEILSMWESAVGAKPLNNLCLSVEKEFSIFKHSLPLLEVLPTAQPYRAGDTGVTLNDDANGIPNIEEELLVVGTALRSIVTFLQATNVFSRQVFNCIPRLSNIISAFLCDVADLVASAPHPTTLLPVNRARVNVGDASTSRDAEQPGMVGLKESTDFLSGQLALWQNACCGEILVWLRSLLYQGFMLLPPSCYDARFSLLVNMLIEDVCSAAMDPAFPVWLLLRDASSAGTAPLLLELAEFARPKIPLLLPLEDIFANRLFHNPSSASNDIPNLAPVFPEGSCQRYYFGCFPPSCLAALCEQVPLQLSPIFSSVNTCAITSYGAPAAPAHPPEFECRLEAVRFFGRILTHSSCTASSRLAVLRQLASVARSLWRKNTKSGAVGVTEEQRSTLGKKWKIGSSAQEMPASTGFQTYANSYAWDGETCPSVSIGLTLSCFLRGLLHQSFASAEGFNKEHDNKSADFLSVDEVDVIWSSCEGALLQGSVADVMVYAEVAGLLYAYVLLPTSLSCSVDIAADNLASSSPSHLTDSQPKTAAELFLQKLHQFIGLHGDSSNSHSTSSSRASVALLCCDMINAWQCVLRYTGLRRHSTQEFPHVGQLVRHLLSMAKETAQPARLWSLYALSVALESLGGDAVNSLNMKDAVRLLLAQFLADPVTNGVISCVLSRLLASITASLQDLKAVELQEVTLRTVFSWVQLRQLHDEERKYSLGAGSLDLQLIRVVQRTLTFCPEAFGEFAKEMVAFVVECWASPHATVRCASLQCVLSLYENGVLLPLDDAEIDCLLFDLLEADRVAFVRSVIRRLILIRLKLYGIKALASWISMLRGIFVGVGGKAVIIKGSWLENGEEESKADSCEGRKSDWWENTTDVDVLDGAEACNESSGMTDAGGSNATEDAWNERDVNRREAEKEAASSKKKKGKNGKDSKENKRDLCIPMWLLTQWEITNTGSSSESGIRKPCSVWGQLLNAAARVRRSSAYGIDVKCFAVKCLQLLIEETAKYTQLQAASTEKVPNIGVAKMQERKDGNESDKAAASLTTCLVNQLERLVGVASNAINSASPVLVEEGVHLLLAIVTHLGGTRDAASMGDKENDVSDDDEESDWKVNRSWSAPLLLLQYEASILSSLNHIFSSYDSSIFSNSPTSPFLFSSNTKTAGESLSSSGSTVSSALPPPVFVLCLSIIRQMLLHKIYSSPRRLLQMLMRGFQSESTAVGSVGSLSKRNSSAERYDVAAALALTGSSQSASVPPGNLGENFTSSVLLLSYSPLKFDAIYRERESSLLHLCRLCTACEVLICGIESSREYMKPYMEDLSRQLWHTVYDSILMSSTPYGGALKGVTSLSHGTIGDATTSSRVGAGIGLSPSITVRYRPYSLIWADWPALEGYYKLALPILFCGLAELLSSQHGLPIDMLMTAGRGAISGQSENNGGDIQRVAEGFNDCVTLVAAFVCDRLAELFSATQFSGDEEATMFTDSFSSANPFLSHLTVHESPQLSSSCRIIRSEAHSCVRFLGSLLLAVPPMTSLSLPTPLSGGKESAKKVFETLPFVSRAPDFSADVFQCIHICLFEKPQFSFDRFLLEELSSLCRKCMSIALLPYWKDRHLEDAIVNRHICRLSFYILNLSWRVCCASQWADMGDQSESLLPLCHELSAACLTAECLAPNAINQEIPSMSSDLMLGWLLCWSPPLLRQFLVTPLKGMEQQDFITYFDSWPLTSSTVNEWKSCVTNFLKIGGKNILGLEVALRVISHTSLQLLHIACLLHSSPARDFGEMTDEGDEVSNKRRNKLQSFSRLFIRCFLVLLGKVDQIVQAKEKGNVSDKLGPFHCKRTCLEDCLGILSYVFKELSYSIVQASCAADVLPHNLLMDCGIEKLSDSNMTTVFTFVKRSHQDFVSVIINALQLSTFKNAAIVAMKTLLFPAVNFRVKIPGLVVDDFIVKHAEKLSAATSFVTPPLFLAVDLPKHESLMNLTSESLRYGWRCLLSCLTTSHALRKLNSSSAGKDTDCEKGDGWERIIIVTLKLVCGILDIMNKKAAQEESLNGGAFAIMRIECVGDESAESNTYDDISFARVDNTAYSGSANCNILEDKSDSNNSRRLPAVFYRKLFFTKSSHPAFANSAFVAPNEHSSAFLPKYLPPHIEAISDFTLQLGQLDPPVFRSAMRKLDSTETNKIENLLKHYVEYRKQVTESKVNKSSNSSQNLKRGSEGPIEKIELKMTFGV